MEEKQISKVQELERLQFQLSVLLDLHLFIASIV